MQKDATNALEKMTSVLKAESKAGESYDSLFDGANSLVTGLGGILKVASHEASVYNSHSQGTSYNKASFITTDERLSRKSRRLAFNARTSLPYLWARRSERDASDAKLQVITVQYHMFTTEIVGGYVGGFYPERLLYSKCSGKRFIKKSWLLV